MYIRNKDVFGRDLFLPEHINIGNCIEITTIKDEFKVFQDIQTGEIYDGNEYYKQYIKSLTRIEQKEFEKK